MTVDDLASLTGLGVQDVIDAADRLGHLALVQRAVDRPDEFRAASPELGLTALLARADAEVARRRHELEATRAAVVAILDGCPNGRPRHSLVRYDDEKAVRARLDELAPMVRFECLTFGAVTSQCGGAADPVRSLHQQTLGRGVAVRAVCANTTRKEQLMASLGWLVDCGGEVRTASALPVEMVIVDREVALVLEALGPRLGAVEIDSPLILTALYALFEREWASATPLAGHHVLDDNELRPAERELLALLGDGYTDESAARKLGLSTRTIQRMVADLMDRLAAVSRFQAGSNAAHRGWI